MLWRRHGRLRSSWCRESMNETLKMIIGKQGRIFWEVCKNDVVVDCWMSVFSEATKWDMLCCLCFQARTPIHRFVETHKKWEGDSIYFETNSIYFETKSIYFETNSIYSEILCNSYTLTTIFRLCHHMTISSWLLSPFDLWCRLWWFVFFWMM